MTATTIQAENLQLVPQTREEVRAYVDQMPRHERVEVSAAWLRMLDASGPVDPWIHGFALVHRDRETVVGSAGFTGPPTADGAVEISYGVNPDHQGNGYATEAAQALTAYAFSSGKVRVVRAHTRPDSNASTGVLVKCGFRRIGEVIDPEDGLVWRWEKHQEEAAVPAAPAGGA